MKTLIADIKYIFCKKNEDLIDDGKRKEYKSSYKKQIIYKNTILNINEFGFENDTQSDKIHHGGIDKAICVYSLKFYEFFEKEYAFELPLCAFGENITIDNLDDRDFCIGDIWKCGEVLFEVSQPRQPCWKISSIVGIKNLTSLVVKSYKTGFYFRVLKKGAISSNDKLKLLKRKYPNLNIEFINKCAFNTNSNQNNIKEILECKELAFAYSTLLLKRYNNKEQGIEDWQKDEY